jgi:hypothetical protein
MKLIDNSVVWAKKILGPSKILDFVPGPFRIHKPAPLSDLAGLILQCPATFTAHYH